jgi:pyruvate formate lyase activating enzyme
VNQSACLAQCSICIDQCPHQALRRVHSAIELDPQLCTLCGHCSEACPTEAIRKVGYEITVAQLLEIVGKDREFYEESGGGVTFSGGDPLDQPDFLKSALESCRREEIHTAVDTAGLADPDLFSEILPLMDLVLFDLKSVDSHKHFQFTGQRNEIILKNLNHAARNARAMMVRVPLIPGFNDQPEELEAIGRHIRSLSIEYPVALLPYHQGADHKYSQLNRQNGMAYCSLPDKDRIRQARQILEKIGLEIRIGG